jgi:hypothetical protein
MKMKRGNLRTCGGGVRTFVTPRISNTHERTLISVFLI